MFSRTMSNPILRVNRHISSTLNRPTVNLNHNLHIPNESMDKKLFLLPLCSHKLGLLCHPNKVNQSMFRNLYVQSSVFQSEIPKLVDVRSIFETSETSSSTRRNRKDHVENEAVFYHTFLENSSIYSGTIYKHDPHFLEAYKLSDKEYESLVDRPIENWHDKSPNDVITSFISIGIYASKKPDVTIEDNQFDPLITALVKNLALSTDDQLIDCFIALMHWPRLNSTRDPQMSKVWKELDETCCKRYLDWSIDKCLFMMDLWYHLRLLRNSFFVHKGLCKISRKTDEFTAAQMVQSLFYLNRKRVISPNISIREYEYHIQKYITKLSMEEIGIFALAFFKTKTTILNKKLLLYIMQRTVEEAEKIDLFILAAISKIVRFSHKPDIGFTANDMVNKVIEKRWDTLSVVTAVHLIHIGTQIQFFDNEALTKLAEKFCKNPSEARLKDMERIVFFLSLYDFIPPSTPDIGHMIVEQLNTPRRVQEAEDHPMMFLSLLYFLSLLQVFPEKQIQQAVNEKRCLDQVESRFNIPQQVVQLDYNRVLEGPAGREHLLSPKMREYLARRYSLYAPDRTRRLKSQFDILMMEVMESTDELLGKDNNFVTHTLPHFPRPDILFRLDDKGNPLPIPEEMKSLSEFEDVHRPVGPGKWYSVVIGGRNMYMHNIPRLVGEQTTKLRQLKSLGYTPIMIPSYYWQKEEDKIAYLKLKYFSNHEQNK